jgi:hypothetical protein
VYASFLKFSHQANLHFLIILSWDLRPYPLVKIHHPSSTHPPCIPLYSPRVCRRLCRVSCTLRLSSVWDFWSTTASSLTNSQTEVINEGGARLGCVAGLRRGCGWFDQGKRPIQNLNFKNGSHLIAQRTQIWDTSLSHVPRTPCSPPSLSAASSSGWGTNASSQSSRMMSFGSGERTGAR